MAGKALDIKEALEEIGKAVFTTITYHQYDINDLDQVINIIDTIIATPAYLNQCELYLKTSKSNYILFFLSNIIYNLKKQGELILTPEVLKWLGSVWKNFLMRSKSYQEMFLSIDDQRSRLKKYYPSGGSFVTQIVNVNQVKEEYIDTLETKEKNLSNLEKFYQQSSELMTWMRPTYYFLLDFYYECKIATGVVVDGSAQVEAKGLSRFGCFNYTYGDIAVITCQALGVLEAAYLLLKKKKTNRRIITIDGKQKFLTPSEIYNVYLDKFNSMKKEITNLNK